YINSRQFTFPSTSATKVYDRIRILNKSEYYAVTGGPVTWADIYNITYPGSGSKPDVIHPSIHYSPSSEHYFVHTVRLQGVGFISLYRLTNPLTNPVLTGINIPVTFYNPAPNANQLGGGTPLISSNESGMKSSPIYRDGYLWAVHSVRNPTSPLSTSLRYYKIDVSTNAVSEEVTFGAADHWYIFPNLTIDKDQNIAINYTRTSLTEYAGAFYSTRLANDPPGLSGSTLLKEGLGNYVVTFGGTRNRWGDYQGIFLDPVTESNIWMFTEFASATNTWGTWVGEIRLVPFPGNYVYTNSSEFDFSDVEVNFNSDTLKAIISNYGLDDLTINSIADSVGPFHLATELTFPLTLETYDSLTIELVFAPTNTGDFEELLEVKSNNPDFVGFTLKGHGYNIATANFNQIYGSSGIQNNGEILTIDLSTGAGTLIGPSLFTEIKSISVDPKTNVVYGVVTNFFESQIVRINVEAGDSYTLFTVPVPDMYGISFDTSGVLYGATKEGHIYEIDFAADTALFKDSIGAPISNIAFNPRTNELWASSYVTFGANKDRVFKINLNTGDTTVVGKTGFNTVNYALVFDGFANLYAVTGTTNQNYNFIQIDTLTGEGTVIGSVGYKNITGLTYIWDGVTSVEEDNTSVIPTEFSLHQNYPNPFNPSTTIEFSLPVASKVKLTVYNILGEVVNVLIDNTLAAGLHSVNWNSTNKAGNKMVSGVYFFELKASGNDGSEFSNLKKMILLK
ncbi:MAG: FlgD immunoglobulin-like domain containing protein, partial [Ignavibacteria bacterium]|nr:FlgD immunoglobulin-like domain containing protein [Ignavibacteria bacterium]